MLWYTERAEGVNDMIKGLGTAFIGPILVLAALGTVLGASLGKTDLFNPATSAAQAEIMGDQSQLEIAQRQAEIAAQQEAAKLELERQAAINAEEQAFLQRGHDLALQQQQQAFERGMAWMEIQQLILLGVGVGAILVVTIAVAYYLYACGQARLLQAQRAERYRQAAPPERGQYTRQPVGVVPGKPFAPQDRQAAPLHQDQPGGNGRGPRVRMHDQG